MATPAISPAAGSYGSPLTVTISDTTPGATIYYTTNGTTPTTVRRVHRRVPADVLATVQRLAVASG